MIKRILDKIRLTFGWIIILIILGAIYFLSYYFAEPKAYDFMTRNVLINKLPFDNDKKIYGSDDIVLIVIDSKSAEKYRWPWKRELYCDIINYLNEYAHPKVIIHDGIINALDTDHPESDLKYFNCIKKINNYIIGFLLSTDDWENEDVGNKYDEEFKKKFSINIEDKTDVSTKLYSSMIPMPKPFFDIVPNAGAVNFLYGAINGNLFFHDEIYRYNKYFINYKGTNYPSLGMKAFMLINNISQVILTPKEIIFPEINRTINHRHTTFQNIVPVRFYKPYDDAYTHQKISAVDIIHSYRLIKKGQKPIIEPKLFKDKIVLIGANVTAGEGLNDSTNSSLQSNHPGVDLQATTVDNLINNEFLCVIPQYVNFLMTILGMLIIFFSAKLLNLSKSVVAIILTVIGYILISAVCFYYYVIVNVITPVVMFVISTIFAYTDKYVAENKNKEKVKSAMSKYMSQDIMKKVVENIDDLGLGGKRAVLSVLFADIRGFTSLSEKMTAQQVSEFLNEYFSEMEPIITSYNGIINKFIGDAVMAIFGEPIQDENHAQNAVKCAYSMLQRVEKLNKKWEREGKPEIEIGVGINTGEVFVGNIGSVNRMEYTVIGDTVNLASRLESYNKTYKTKILISTSTYKAVRQIADVIKIPEVQIRGKSNKIDIYEVLKVKLD